MIAEILVNVTPMETRVALVENGAVQELYIERSQTRGIVGNIYKGKVVRVLPGMQAAFVDIGLERAAFIHVSDIAADKDEQLTKPIQYRVHEGQPLIVQVTKDPLGSKGARLSMLLSIPSRYLVFMPGADHIGISQRIDDEVERQRLKTLVAEAKVEAGISSGGFILRTVAEGISKAEIQADMSYLQRLYRVLTERIQHNPLVSLIYEDLPLYLRVARDMVRVDVERIRVDSADIFVKIQEFIGKYMPTAMPLFERYVAERPIFDLYAVEDEISKALSRKVELKNGGYLIIDQTEAMTTIDVNTGAFVGHRKLEETIFKTNLEAITVICRQLRLRNLGGIIILDFIDMADDEHRRQVNRMLEKQLERDHAKSTVTGVSELGLVEMTRKRTRESLEHLLTENCSVCQGRGRQKTAQTVCYEVFREILRAEQAYENDQYLVLAAQSVVDCLLDEESSNVADLEEHIGKPIRLQVEPIYNQEQFDVILQ